MMMMMMTSLPVSAGSPRWDIAPCSRSYWCCSAAARKHQSVHKEARMSPNPQTTAGLNRKLLTDLYMRVKAVVPQQRPKLNDLLQMLFGVSLVRDKHLPCVERKHVKEWIEPPPKQTRTKRVWNLALYSHSCMKWPYNNCLTPLIKFII